MAKYDLLFEQVNAHLINAANVADTGTWPAWISAITDTGNGTWLVNTTTNGSLEVLDGTYIAITSEGTIPIQMEPSVIETLYTPVVE